MRLTYGVFTVVILLFSLISGTAQSFFPQTQKTEERSDTIIKRARPFELSNINNASIETSSLQNRTRAIRLTKAEKNTIKDRTDTIVARINIFFSDTSAKSVSDMNYRELESLENKLSVLNKKVLSVQDQIYEQLIDLQDGRDALLSNQDRWSLTLTEKVDRGTYPAIDRRIRSVISNNDSVLSSLQRDIDFLFTQADRLTDQEIRLDQLSNELDELISLSGNRLLRRDMPPVWALFGSDSSLISGSSGNFTDRFNNETETLFSTYDSQIITSILILVLSFLIVFWLKFTVTKLKQAQKDIMLSLYINEIFSKPIEVALLISVYFFYILVQDVPTIYGTFLSIILIISILRVASEIIPPGYKKLLIGFAVTYILYWCYNLFYDYNIATRLILFLIQGIVLFTLANYLNSRRIVHSVKHAQFNRFLSLASVSFIVFLVVAILGNIGGMLSFSELLTGGIVKSGFFIISTYVGFHLSVALVFLLFSSKLFHKSKIIREQTDFLMGKAYSLLRFTFVIIAFFLVFEQFNIRESFVQWGSGVLNKQFMIGKAPFTLISIILFVFVIWLSIFISKIVRHILHEEVFTRIEVQRGMPGTIIMLVRITVVSVGFLLAAAAAGMQLSNLTIIIGAFSVGIGFGLQNIFNNLVSGLILAFERPIKEGDIVEVNTLLGTVKKIGIRSSIVKTFDGAEVIVPNGTLISNDLINWTLSDQYRRADIRIGVKYGTDPEIVNGILLKCAENNPRVLNAPKSKAYFIGFGDSSLNFRLLAWIDQDHRLEVESELRIAINKSLKEADIEIPFPQRDLHVRSMADDVGQKITKK
ncbi:MAG TPA: mechanosensitive ion channel domain-containing protein [Bacteroidales bacterium]|nr:mechanosensitive ion channel domain-containing protein [Bacteroidales bacterium]